MIKIKSIVLMIIFLGCATAREDIVLEAFTEPFLDWYSLKLYADGDFDLHIPSIDYSGTYNVSGDTVFLKSIENEKRTMSTETNTKEIVKEQRWIFLIDSKARKIRTIKNTESPTIVIDIINIKL